MVEVNDSEELEAWLKDKPRDWAVAIAARAALRVSPLLVNIFDEDARLPRTALVLPIFRVTASSVAASQAPSDAVNAAAAIAARATAR